MKLLKWSSICGDRYWDISAQILEDLAYKNLFHVLEAGNHYAYVEANLEAARISRTDLHLLQEHLKLSGFKFKSVPLKIQFTKWVAERDMESGAGSNYQFERQAELYRDAKAGSIASMKKLIHLRSDRGYEYETVEVIEF
jgi:hypothetical protein